jgi:hypothetical protein
MPDLLLDRVAVQSARSALIAAQPEYQAICMSRADRDRMLKAWAEKLLPFSTSARGAWDDLLAEYGINKNTWKRARRLALGLRPRPGQNGNPNGKPNSSGAVHPKSLGDVRKSAGDAGAECVDESGDAECPIGVPARPDWWNGDPNKRDCDMLDLPEFQGRDLTRDEDEWEAAEAAEEGQRRQATDESPPLPVQLSLASEYEAAEAHRMSFNAIWERAVGRDALAIAAVTRGVALMEAVMKGVAA